MADEIAIRVEGLGKKYIIAQAKRERYATLRGAIAERGRVLWSRLSDVAHGRALTSTGATDQIWALKDVSFTVRRGEVLGIIGRNGAGKSTLLKIFSRITEPTEGRVEISGRVSSLLEVGTGFHPELTGRENVYLNGTILGMTRVEIRRKFDQIVDFAGVETFLDTPVKRYSTGMSVRLAFAVAAHLEPEILVVDEVLAVGDAEFQRKCLGKIGEVASAGRTVIFVSHQMSMIQALCRRCIALNLGRIVDDDQTEDVIMRYLSAFSRPDAGDIPDDADRSGDGSLRLTAVRMRNEHGQAAVSFTAGLPLIFEFEYENRARVRSAAIAFTIYDQFGAALTTVNLDLTGFTFRPKERGAIACRVGRLPLLPGSYRINVRVHVGGTLADRVRDAAAFSVDTSVFFPNGRVPPSRVAAFMLDHEWQEGAAAEGPSVKKNDVAPSLDQPDRDE